jgi:hypothetical protein
MVHGGNTKLCVLIIIQEISHVFNMSITPAKAGVQNYSKLLDFRFRGNDAGGEISCPA